MKKNFLCGAVLCAGIVTAQAQTSPGVQWERIVGGAEADFAEVVRATSDGGYLLGGSSYSDVSGAKATPGFGAGDFWIVKLDAAGNRQWDATFGGDEFDGLHTAQQTADGGFILGGVSFSGASGNKTAAHHGEGDFWIVKLNASGARQWDKSFGGASNDVLHAIAQTSDGGFILGGTSASGISGNKSSAGYGEGDFWVVKLDSSGNKQWEKSFGGSDVDELHALRPTSDGGFIAGGHSFSGVSGNKTSAALGAGSADHWIVKLNANGTKQWERVFGGDDAEALHDLQPTSDGGFILGGHSASGTSAHKSSANIGAHDYWIVKLDGNGTRQWDRTFGGVNEDLLHSVHQTSDGGYILGGVSASGISGNKTSAGVGADFGSYWVLKLDAAGHKQWEQAVRGNFSDTILRLQPAHDGYMLAGFASAAPGAEADYHVARLATPLLIHSFGAQSHGVYRAQLFGRSGARFILQASSDFSNWISLVTNVAGANGLVSFQATNPPGTARRFFRVKEQP